MSDKRKVATDALETLGTIIDETAQRDAIHLAVEPCIAGEDLKAGQHIGIENGLATKKAKKKLGIVDPFIYGLIPKGRRFWLVVYPRQITSLRHVWSHPDEEEATTQQEPIDDTSTAWLKEFACKIGITYERLMYGANEYVEYGETLYMGDNETYSDYYDEMPTFWEHYENIRGKKPKYTGGFFSCSC